MRKTKPKEIELIFALKEHCSGKKVQDICYELGISISAFYKWRQVYLNSEECKKKRIKELEEENYRLKKIYIKMILFNQMLKSGVINKSYA